jgi:antitoxin VapB
MGFSSAHARSIFRFSKIGASAQAVVPAPGANGGLAIVVGIRYAYIHPGHKRKTQMARSTVFKTNRSQAVRLPKSVAFPEGVHEVEIIKVGQSRVISPVGKGWEVFFDHVPPASDDFMIEREQPMPEEREPF